MLLSPGAERGGSIDRRSGVDRRAGAERRAAFQGGADSRHLPSHGFGLGTVTEPLTGLFNRYPFEATLKREAARCLRYQSRLSLLLLDVDQLKAVNDRGGHPAGDQMLVRVAGAIRDSLRGCDIASRYGGDEFAVILPHTDVPAARFVAERICDKGGGAHAPIKVTVSGGLADLSLAASSPSEARLIAAADRALYLAKGRGGNCVAEEGLPCRD